MSDFTFPLVYKIPSAIYAYDLIDNIPYPSASYFFKASQAGIIKPLFDTSKLTDTSYMFYDCINIVAVPQFDTSNVTNTRYMFYNCSKLITVPYFDTSNVTNMSYMFTTCSKLEAVPQFDTSNVTNMIFMFQNCSRLITVPYFDTSNVTNMQSMFDGCSKLEAVPQFDTSSINTTSGVALFGYNNITTLIKFGGLLNLGKNIASGTISNCIERLPNLTKESVLNIINGLYDRVGNGMTTIITLKMHANHLAMLSDEEKAIATNKGWTLS